MTVLRQGFRMHKRLRPNVLLRPKNNYSVHSLKIAFGYWRFVFGDVGGTVSL